MDILDSKLVSIVIPSYNEEKYIQKTLHSISKQTFTGKLKVIIADGNSTDKTIEKISWCSKTYTNLDIELVEGGKVARGRNNGADKVKTPYILFMDADSILIEHNILELALKYRDFFSIISCKQKSINNNWKSKLIWKIFNTTRDLMPTTFCTGCFFFISKEKFEELGKFDETLQNSEDFWLSKNIDKNKFLILDKFIGQDDRRFKKFGYLSFLKILFMNYIYKNDKEWFIQDVGYWKPY
tara:strand:- start:5221 stop:5940 length:720 start_codon:yes stop_codon:yes gene_type:complete